MNKQLYTLLLLWIALVWVQPVSASPEAEYRKLSKAYTLHTDGSQEFRYQMELTLFTHTAMNNTYGESFIVYDPRYQELQIHAAYTVQKNGNQVPAPANAFVEVLPRSAVNAPAYNQLKEMVVVHTGLELGATIYLDYSIFSKPGYLKELDMYEELQQTSPVKEYQLTISVPENKPLSYTLHGIRAKESISNQEGRQLVQWTLRNLPAASRSPEVYTMNGDVPFLTATTFGSEKEALKELYGQFNSKQDIQLLTLAEAITEKTTNHTEKLFALLNYVTNEIDNSRVSLPEAGYRIRSVDEVINTGYGTFAEKVNLLSGLLNAMNIPATPVALYKVNAQPGSCGLSAIQELFVIAAIENRPYYLHSLGNTPAIGAFLADRVPVLSLETGERASIEKLSSAIDLQYLIQLDDLQAQVNMSGKTGISFLPYSATPLTALGITDKEATGTLEKDGLSFTAKETKEVHKKNGYILFPLPDSPKSIAHGMYSGYTSERMNILTLLYPVHESYAYRIEVPENMKLATPVAVKNITNKAGKLSVTIEQTGNIIEVKRTLEIPDPTIAPADYGDFRKLIVHWSDNQGKTLLFKTR
ncbi:MAG: DUF3857 domain-containing protein [Tannerellaceae bacterium]|nr:DUF3857 domain-containing protein [Tannerellaceae bacterium]